MSLQQQQQQQQQEGRQAEKKQLYHYKDVINPNDKPAWAKEVSPNIHEKLLYHVFFFFLELVKKANMCDSSWTLYI